MPAVRTTLALLDLRIGGRPGDSVALATTAEFSDGIESGDGEPDEERNLDGFPQDVLVTRLVVGVVPPLLAFYAASAPYGSDNMGRRASEAEGFLFLDRQHLPEE